MVDCEKVIKNIVKIVFSDLSVSKFSKKTVVFGHSFIVCLPLDVINLIVSMDEIIIWNVSCDGCVCVCAFTLYCHGSNYHCMCGSGKACLSLEMIDNFKWPFFDSEKIVILFVTF